MSKIMIVEDSKFVANAIKIIMTQGGLDVTTVEDFTNVVDQVKKEKPNLIILDLNLPEISGEEIFKTLKSDAETSNIKIIILTAKSDAMKWEQELKKADKFMAKPFDNDELLKTVKSLL